jgi:vacuolar-type H+-ATPase subunit F/Vma7
MKHSLRIFCDESLASGLRLAGLAAEGVADIEACDRLIHQALEHQHTEVVVVDTAIADQLPDETRERVAESEKPVFVSLPLTSNRGNEDVQPYVHNYVEDLFRKTIGKNIAIPETVG